MGGFGSFTCSLMFLHVFTPGFYHPQGNVFTSVCHSVHRGVSVPACTTGHIIGGLCPGGSLSGEGLCLGRVSVQRGVSVQGSLSGGLCPGVSVWGSLSRGSLSGGLSPGGLCLGGSLSRRGVSVQEGGLCPGGGSLSGGLS